jgi:hypothetical protein
MMSTNELLKDMFIPNKIEQVAKILSWFDQGLLDPRGVLKYCLQFMSEETVDDLVALIELECEDTESKEGESEYLEALLEQLPPIKDSTPPHKTFNGFQF